MTAQVKIQKEGGKLISKEKENCDLVLASMGLLHMTFLYPKTDPPRLLEKLGIYSLLQLVFRS
jgi:hypothetical protein